MISTTKQGVNTTNRKDCAERIQLSKEIVEGHVLYVREVFPHCMIPKRKFFIVEIQDGDVVRIRQQWNMMKLVQIVQV